MSDGYKLSGYLTHVAPSSKTSVIILHPHPLYGGDMNNHVVRTLERIFLSYGFTTLRFDFRGASSSPQGYSGVSGAVIDSLNALELLKSKSECKEVGIVGYSFGASTAMRVALMNPPPFLVSLSASKELISEAGFDIGKLVNIESPTLMFHGKADSMIPFTDLMAIAESLRSNPIRIELLEGEGHFYQRSLSTVESIVREFIDGLYK